MPGGLIGGALVFLCFGWATEAVAVAAARGATYFFGGMTAGWEEGEREGDWREEGRVREGSGEKTGKNGGKMRSPRRQDGPTRPFRFSRRPRRPRKPGSTWVRRHQFRPEPAKNGFLKTRLDRFFGVGATKTFEKGLLKARLEKL